MPYRAVCIKSSTDMVTYSEAGNVCATQDAILASVTQEDASTVFGLLVLGE